MFLWFWGGEKNFFSADFSAELKGKFEDTLSPLGNKAPAIKDENFLEKEANQKLQKILTVTDNKLQDKAISVIKKSLSNTQGGINALKKYDLNSNEFISDKEFDMYITYLENNIEEALKDETDVEKEKKEIAKKIGETQAKKKKRESLGVNEDNVQEYKVITKSAKKYGIKTAQLEKKFLGKENPKDNDFYEFKKYLEMAIQVKQTLNDYTKKKGVWESWTNTDYYSFNADKKKNLQALVTTTIIPALEDGGNLSDISVTTNFLGWDTIGLDADYKQMGGTKEKISAKLFIARFLKTVQFSAPKDVLLQPSALENSKENIRTFLKNAVPMMESDTDDLAKLVKYQEELTSTTNKNDLKILAGKIEGALSGVNSAISKKQLVFEMVGNKKNSDTALAYALRDIGSSESAAKKFTTLAKKEIQGKKSEVLTQYQHGILDDFTEKLDKMKNSAKVHSLVGKKSQEVLRALDENDPQRQRIANDPETFRKGLSKIIEFSQTMDWFVEKYGIQEAKRIGPMFDMYASMKGSGKYLSDKTVHMTADVAKLIIEIALTAGAGALVASTKVGKVAIGAMQTAKGVQKVGAIGAGIASNAAAFTGAQALVDTLGNNVLPGYLKTGDMDMMKAGEIFGSNLALFTVLKGTSMTVLKVLGADASKLSQIGVSLVAEMGALTLLQQVQKGKFDVTQEEAIFNAFLVAGFKLKEIAVLRKAGFSRVADGLKAIKKNPRGEISPNLARVQERNSRLEKPEHKKEMEEYFGRKLSKGEHDAIWDIHTREKPDGITESEFNQQKTKDLHEVLETPEAKNKRDEVRISMRGKFTGKKKVEREAMLLAKNPEKIRIEAAKETENSKESSKENNSSPQLQVPPASALKPAKAEAGKPETSKESNSSTERQQQIQQLEKEVAELQNQREKSWTEADAYAQTNKEVYDEQFSDGQQITGVKRKYIRKAKEMMDAREPIKKELRKKKKDLEELKKEEATERGKQENEQRQEERKEIEKENENPDSMTVERLQERIEELDRQIEAQVENAVMIVDGKPQNSVQKEMKARKEQFEEVLLKKKEARELHKPYESVAREQITQNRREEKVQENKPVTLAEVKQRDRDSYDAKVQRQQERRNRVAEKRLLARKSKDVVADTLKLENLQKELDIFQKNPTSENAKALQNQAKTTLKDAEKIATEDVQHTKNKVKNMTGAEKTSALREFLDNFRDFSLGTRRRARITYIILVLLAMADGYFLLNIFDKKTPHLQPVDSSAQSQDKPKVGLEVRPYINNTSSSASLSLNAEGKTSANTAKSAPAPKSSSEQAVIVLKSDESKSAKNIPFNSSYFNNQGKYIVPKYSSKNSADSTLYGITRQYNKANPENTITPQELAKYNHISDPSRIQAGQEINFIPKTKKYTVKKGETVSGLRKKYNLTQDQFLALNPAVAKRSNLYLFTSENVNVPE